MIKSLRNLAGTVCAALCFACSSGGGPDGDPNAVASVVVQPSAHTLVLGVANVVQLNATARNAAGATLTGHSFTWRSGTSSVATVDNNGLVTAVGVGSATIFAASGGVEGSAAITVTAPPVATVTVTLGTPIVVSGGTSTATATLRDAAGNELTGRQVTWSSSNNAVATVSLQGQVNAVALGTATITATSEGRSASATFCVLATAPNLRIEQLTITQAIQRSAGDIPLVANGNPAEVRVHATSTSSLPAGCQAPRIRTIFYNGATEITRSEVVVTGPMPTALNSTAPSIQFILGTQHIVPSLRVVAEIDPANLVPEPSDTDNSWPASGTPHSLMVQVVPTLQLNFVPIRLTNGNSIGTVNDFNMPEYLYATRQVYPISEVDWEIAEPMSTNVTFGTGGQVPWLQMLQELDVRRVAEASTRYYVGAMRPPPGVTSTEFGGFGYVPFNPASTGPTTRTNVLVGVGWFNRQRQTTELVAHELGHNHGRRHAPCGGASGPDPLYPYAGAVIGHTGVDMYTWSVNQGIPPELSATGSFDIMSYCTPAWISDYNYEGLLAARLAAGPLASVAQGASCDCLVAWGAIDSSGITLNPAFVVRTRVQLPDAGSYVIEGVRSDGSVAFARSFEPSEIDHAPGVRHFAMAVPVSAADRASLASLRVRGPRGTAQLTRSLVAADALVMRQAATASTLRRLPVGNTSALSWPAGPFRAAMVRNPVTGAVLGISTSGTLTLGDAPAEVEVILSDGVRSETVRLRREE